MIFKHRRGEGYYGIGRQVGSQTPETTLHQVAQTSALAGYINHYGSTDLDLSFSCFLKYFKNDNPAPNTKLALPLWYFQCVADFYHTKQTLVALTAEDILTTAFFFLLCPGQYTMNSSR